MRTLLLVLVISLVAAPAAAAKEDNAAIVIGPFGTALVEPPSTFASAFARLSAGEAPSGPFALVYVQRRFSPTEPGRWYPRSSTYCDATGRCVRDTALVGSFGSGRITGLFRSAPPRLARLTRDGKKLSVHAPLALGIELAFGQASSSQRLAKPAGCVVLRAVWRGTPKRPVSFCVGMNGGVWAGGRAYPLYSGLAAQLLH
jgi:hypothetical protein